jgi:hypothetical protein
MAREQVTDSSLIGWCCEREDAVVLTTEESAVAGWRWADKSRSGDENGG